jgi:hypothetical protein
MGLHVMADGTRDIQRQRETGQEKSGIIIIIVTITVMIIIDQRIKITRHKTKRHIELRR